MSKRNRTTRTKITALLETSDHIGYCSGSECDYESEVIEEIIDVPNSFEPKNNEEYKEYLKKVNLVCGSQSNYCSLSKKCLEHGLGRHEYRYTVKKVEFINSENDK